MEARTCESSCGSVCRGRRRLAHQWSSSPNSATCGQKKDGHSVEQQGVSTRLKRGDITWPTLTPANQR